MVGGGVGCDIHCRQERGGGERAGRIEGEIRLVPLEDVHFGSVQVEGVVDHDGCVFMVW